MFSSRIRTGIAATAAKLKTSAQEKTKAKPAESKTNQHKGADNIKTDAHTKALAALATAKEAEKNARKEANDENTRVIDASNKDKKRISDEKKNLKKEEREKNASEAKDKKELLLAKSEPKITATTEQHASTLTHRVAPDASATLASNNVDGKHSDRAIVSAKSNASDNTAAGDDADDVAVNVAGDEESPDVAESAEVDAVNDIDANGAEESDKTEGTGGAQVKTHKMPGLSVNSDTENDTNNDVSDVKNVSHDESPVAQSTSSKEAFIHDEKQALVKTTCESDGHTLKIIEIDF